MIAMRATFFGAHVFVLFGHVEIKPDRDQSRYVKRISQEFAPALNEDLPAPLAGLAGHWRAACEAGDLFASQSADLGALDQDRGGCGLADSRD